MKQDKLYTFITKNQSFVNDPEIKRWIEESEENEEEYIRLKNLWALMQSEGDLTETQIKDGFLKIKRHLKRTKRKLKISSFIKYAAIIIVTLIIGYSINEFKLGNEIAKNEIFVPKGSRSSVVLPDGTKVWLSNGSRLIYPEKFSGKIRNVELEGEGFFDVAHDKIRSFSLKIGVNRIQVLGTKFAVVAYPEDKFVKADLISGQIQFDIKKENKENEYYSYLMKPDKRLVFNKESGKLVESEISGDFYNYWINGVYEFKNETFEDLAKKIERIYNVELIFNDQSLKIRMFTGSLSVNDDIYTMMEVFKRTSGRSFIYSHQGNQIFIGESN